MIVCLCRGLSESAIRATIQDGADTARKVAMACGAGVDCGACCSFVRALLDETEGSGLEADASVHDLAVLAYREAYGGEVREQRFRPPASGPLILDKPAA